MEDLLPGWPGMVRINQDGPKRIDELVGALDVRRHGLAKKTWVELGFVRLFPF